jgi:paired amphipathic helix protein Sin3a
MVKLIHDNPGVAIPVVLGRLKQKDSEWRKVKQDMASLWTKVRSTLMASQ